MLSLSWRLEAVTPLTHALAPQLALRLGVAAGAGARVLGGFLRVQVRFEPLARAYDAVEQARLVPLLGPRERWGEATRSLLWTIAGAALPVFEGAASIDLPIDCSLDFTAAATRYFAALERGGAPIVLLVSGTVMHATPDGLHVVPIGQGQEAEARGEVPLATWRDLVARHHPDGAWLRLRVDLLERLERWRAARSIPTSDQALERLLAGAGA